MMVKICGITNRDDAMAAVEAGASAIGFNFYRDSPRYISHTGAAMIAEKIPANVWKVGIFVNETPRDHRTLRRGCRPRRRAIIRDERSAWHSHMAGAAASRMRLNLISRTIR